jgi:hypothetical protein
VNWSIVIVVNLIDVTKYRPFSTLVTVSVCKFSYIAIALILKCLSESISFHTLSTFLSVL